MSFCQPKVDIMKEGLIDYNPMSLPIILKMCWLCSDGSRNILLRINRRNKNYPELTPPERGVLAGTQRHLFLDYIHENRRF